MDATKEVELAKEYFVQGFPTLMLFRKGVKVGDYDGGRTSGEIVDYMRKQADPNWKPPPSVVLQLSQDNFTKTAKTKDLMLVSVIFFHFLSVMIFSPRSGSTLRGASTASSWSLRWRARPSSSRAGASPSPRWTSYSLFWPTAIIGYKALLFTFSM